MNQLNLILPEDCPECGTAVFPGHENCPECGARVLRKTALVLRFKILADELPKAIYQFQGAQGKLFQSWCDFAAAVNNALKGGIDE
jgi:hypothetical protein